MPGLVFTSSSLYGHPYLRGVGGMVVAAGDPGVAIFVDGVYLVNSMQAIRDFFDVKRVEVVKGPHAVHLGRNVVGGAISILNEEPVSYTEGYADMQYGSYNRRQLRAAYNFPLSDAMALRFAATGISRDGYSDNVYRNEDLDDQHYYAWRGKFRYRPDDDLDVVIGVEQGRQDDTQGLAKYPNPDIGINGGILAGGSVPDDPRQVNHNVDEQQDLDNDLYSIKLSWKTAGLQLRSITAYQQTDSVKTEDLDATEVDFSSSYNVTDTNAVSQEFRFSSFQQTPLSWVAGIYMLYQDADKYLDLEFPLMAVRSSAASTADNDSYSIFGELGYAFAPAWQMRAGLRYSYDESAIDLQQTIVDTYGVLGAAGSSSVDINERDSWDAFTPELVISFEPDADTFYYARVSRGFKSGGYNAYSIQPAFDPEYLWAYEVGLKNTWPDSLVKFNLALFHYDYNDIQLLTLPPGAPLGTLPVVDNAARAQIDGIDLQFWSEPLTSFELTAGATLMDARFREYISVDPNNPADDPDRSGDPLPQAPSVSWILGGAYQWKISHYGDLRLSADYRYQSAVYFNPYHDAAVRQPAYGLLGMALGFESYRGNWHAQLYGSNLGDELYAQNIIRVDPVTGTVRLWGEPRTIGFRLGYRF